MTPTYPTGSWENIYTYKYLSIIIELYNFQEHQRVHVLIHFLIQTFWRLQYKLSFFSEISASDFLNKSTCNKLQIVFEFQNENINVYLFVWGLSSRSRISHSYEEGSLACHTCSNTGYPLFSKQETHIIQITIYNIHVSK